MGRFKDSGETGIIAWLKEHKYEKGTGAQGQPGYVHIYEIEDKNYVYVTINIEQKKIYVYKEDCVESYINSSTIDIESDWLTDLESFIDNVDKVLESWIG